MQLKKEYLTEKEVSEMTGIALSTLRNARHLGKLFPYTKLNKSVRYLKADIIEYMSVRRIKTKDI